jgi:hypothetical protein
MERRDADSDLSDPLTVAASPSAIGWALGQAGTGFTVTFTEEKRRPHYHS